MASPSLTPTGCSSAGCSSVRFILAEKPTQARAIADFLAKERSHQWRQDQLGAYVLGQDVIVAADGHLFEDFMPEDYDPRYAHRRLEDLPIIPPRFQKKERTTRRAQAALTAVRQHLPRADRVLHACDYDREGQLIGDEIFHHFNVEWGTIDRLPITGYDDVSIAAAFAAVHPNERVRSLSTAALMRSRADWLWGMNLSRVYGIEAEKEGYREGIPIGRVISPTLDLLARRERAIAAFISVKHYNLKVVLNTDAGPVVAEWQRPAWMEEGFDEEGRLVRLAIAEQIRDRIEKARFARVLRVEPTERRMKPPLPFTLAELQVRANKEWRYTAKQIHEAAETLYNRHFLISYPRADSRYYPASLHARAPEALEAIKANIPALGVRVDCADRKRMSEAFNDEKVAVGKVSHHAIAPLAKMVDFDRLTNIERDVYELICRFYVAQFYPDAVAHGRVVELTVDLPPEHRSENGPPPKDTLRMSASSIDEFGWRPVLGLGEQGVDKTFLDIEPGADLTIRFATVEPSQTKNPQRFTDGTLIKALNDVGAFVEHPELKEQLGSNARLGTASTQSETIERLITKRLIERDGDGKLKPTSIGLAIAQALPKALQGPALTSQWERELDEIANGKRKGADWLGTQVVVIEELVKEPVTISFAEWKTKKRRKKDGDDDSNGASSSGRSRGVA
jgi:DNA topoisomerase-3